jgi:hypothetical protein
MRCRVAASTGRISELVTTFTDHLLSALMKRDSGAVRGSTLRYHPEHAPSMAPFYGRLPRLDGLRLSLQGVVQSTKQSAGSMKATLLAAVVGAVQGVDLLLDLSLDDNYPLLGEWAFADWSAVATVVHDALAPLHLELLDSTAFLLDVVCDAVIARGVSKSLPDVRAVALDVLLGRVVCCWMRWRAPSP